MRHVKYHEISTSYIERLGFLKNLLALQIKLWKMTRPLTFSCFPHNSNCLNVWLFSGHVIDSSSVELYFFSIFLSYCSVHVTCDVLES